MALLLSTLNSKNIVSINCEDGWHVVEKKRSGNTSALIEKRQYEVTKNTAPFACLSLIVTLSAAMSKLS